MRPRSGLAFLLVIASGLAGCLTADTGKQGLSTSLKSHVTFLASDSLEGRLVGTPGIEKAGNYIEGEFERCGLKPAFDGSYFQKFGIDLGLRFEATPVLEIAGRALVYSKDFSVLPFSGSAAVEGGAGRVPAGADSSTSGVVFVLTDIDRENQRWTVTGRDGLLEWMRDTAAKVMKRGADAIVFVNGGPENPDAALHTFALSRAHGRLDIPVLEVTYEGLRQASGIAWRQVAVTKAGGAEFLDMPSQECTVDVEAVPARIQVENVGGLLRGRGAGYILIGAHYDHLGYGDIASTTPWRREIHHGADDNASGVAALIETARIMASYGEGERSVIFVAFTAEELGALGSEYYCNHAPYPIDSTVAMINLDTVGRLEQGRLIAFGARSAREFDSLLAEAEQGHGVEIVEKEEIFGFSDQSPFYTRGIPSLHFFTGAYEDYHSPDDVWQNIDFDGLACVTSYVADFAGLLTFQPKRLTPVVVEPPPMPSMASGGGAHLGIVPDFAYAGTGVGIKGPVAGSPAEEAGLKGGDVIVKIDDAQIPDLRGLMAFLMSRSPGDTIQIQVMRGALPESMTAVLGVRSASGHGD